MLKYPRQFFVLVLLALVALLADPTLTGNYGTKTTAQGLLPPIAPLPATAGG